MYHIIQIKSNSSLLSSSLPLQTHYCALLVHNWHQMVCFSSSGTKVQTHIKSQGSVYCHKEEVLMAQLKDSQRQSDRRCVLRCRASGSSEFNNKEEDKPVAVRGRQDK